MLITCCKNIDNKIFQIYKSEMNKRSVLYKKGDETFYIDFGIG